MLWEIPYMAEQEELQGQQLYDRLMELAPAGLVETDWAVRAGLNKGWFGNLKAQGISPRTSSVNKLLRFIGKTQADLYAKDARRGTLYVDANVLAAAADSVQLRMVDLDLSMGHGSNLDDYAEESTIDFDAGLLRTITRSPPERLFVARGVGDSMFPTLINDDMVVIDTTQQMLTLQDRVWAISLFGAGGIKRLRAIGKQRVEVISDNPAHDNQEVEAEDLRLLGRVIWVGRKM